MTTPGILINLQRCTGCWTCSLACKVAYNLADDEWWQFVRTMGNGSGIDRPAGVWPNLSMSWIPVHTQDCTLCGERTEEGLDPYCVHNCPNNAMTYGDLDDAGGQVAKEMERLKGMGYRVFKLAEWERSRPEVVYADKS
jgi:Fe-S-cluster-containing dehydrogenase component